MHSTVVFFFDHLQWLPPLDFSTISWPWYQAWHFPNCELFPWIICKGCSMPQRPLTLSDTWFRRVLGLAYGSVVETSFPKLGKTFPNFFILNITRYFYRFCLSRILGGGGCLNILKGKRNAYLLWIIFVSKIYCLFKWICVWNVKYSYLNTLWYISLQKDHVRFAC